MGHFGGLVMGPAPVAPPLLQRQPSRALAPGPWRALAGFVGEILAREGLLQLQKAVVAAGLQVG